MAFLLMHIAAKDVTQTFLPVLLEWKQTGKSVLLYYRPVNFGARFSKNALTPSPPSSDSKQRICASVS